MIANSNGLLHYFVYFTTDERKRFLEMGVTGDLAGRIVQMAYRTAKTDIFHHKKCFHLVYWETFTEATEAAFRLNQLEKLSDKKKKALVAAANPQWRFLNEECLRIFDSRISDV